MNTITLADDEWRVVEGAMVVAAKEVTVPALFAVMESIRVKIEEQHYADICAATDAVEAEMEAELIEGTRPENTVTVSLSLIAWLEQGQTKDDVLADVVSGLHGDVDTASVTTIGRTKMVRVAVKFPALNDSEGRLRVRLMGQAMRNAHDSVVVGIIKRKANR